MIKSLINKWKERKQAKRLNKVMSDPTNRLALMKAGYAKFSAVMTERERNRMKKEIKKLERAVKNWDREMARN